VDLVFNGLEPKNGVIEIRLTGDDIQGQQAEAMLQALEVGPGDGGSGAAPKTAFAAASASVPRRGGAERR
jgi:hypothetical protein